MKRSIALGLVVVVIVIGIGVVFLNRQKSPLFNPQATSLATNKMVSPSETLKEYTDPSGFAFNYPDNLSITKNEITDNNTYSDIQLSTKDVSGSLSLKIADSKYKSLDEWLKLNKGTTKEVSWGNLKATEVTTTDRLLLGALDKGVLFTIEMPLLEKDFWMKVYDIVLKDFSFVSPAQQNAVSQGSGSAASDDVNFEGEEVIE